MTTQLQLLLLLLLLLLVVVVVINVAMVLPGIETGAKIYPNRNSLRSTAYTKTHCMHYICYENHTKSMNILCGELMVRMVMIAVRG